MNEACLALRDEALRVRRRGGSWRARGRGRATGSRRAARHKPAPPAVARRRGVARALRCATNVSDRGPKGAGSIVLRLPAALWPTPAPADGKAARTPKTWPKVRCADARARAATKGCPEDNTGDSTTAALASAETTRDGAAASAQHTQANKAQKEHSTVQWRAAATTEAARAPWSSA